MFTCGEDGGAYQAEVCVEIQHGDGMYGVSWCLIKNLLPTMPIIPTNKRIFGSKWRDNENHVDGFVEGFYAESW